MKYKKLDFKIIMSTLSLIALSGLITGSFYDLQINKLLYMRGSFYPSLFRLSGEMPMVISLVALILIYIKNAPKDNYLPLGFCLTALLAYPIVSGLGIPKYFDSRNPFFSLAIIFFYYVCGFVLSKKLKFSDKNQTLKYILIVIISFTAIFLVTEIMKNIWGRMRFFEMLRTNDYSGFTDWWVMKGRPASDIFKSFPSGHTSAAASILILLKLDSYFKIEKAKMLKIFLIAWPIFVFISRILDGAHFLSDVSAGLLIAIIISYLAERKL